jgi:thiol-disulfide isomerase/thioredoxin
MNRRHAMAGGVAAAAAAAGAGWHLWREQARAEAAAVEPFWALRLQRPDGGELALATLRGKPLVVNFWATWCPPCVKEMPEIDRFHQAYARRGWQVLGIAVDRIEPVKDFISRHPVGFAIALAGLDGVEYSRMLGNAKGLLPFTAVFDARGRLVQRKLGQTTAAELSAWADAI